MTKRHRDDRGGTHVVAGVLLASTLTGCASVTIDLPGSAGETVEAAPERVREREALAAAARSLDAELPDAPTAREAFGRLVFGGRKAAQEDAAHAYLKEVRGADPVASVLADADAVLARARAVAEAGRLASQATEPLPSDVSLLEGAIADVRRGRALYAEALRVLADAGAPVEKAEIRQVKRAFSQSADDIGIAADLVAARLPGDRPERVARPAGGATSGY